MIDSLVFSFILIIIGLALLIKSASFLVYGTLSMAKRLGFSDLAMGLTVTAIATSLPEFIVAFFVENIQFYHADNSSITFGSIIGSNIFNIFLIIGIGSVIHSLNVYPSITHKTIPYSLLSIIVFFILVNDNLFYHSTNNALSITDAIILLLMYGFFLFQVLKSKKRRNRMIGKDHSIIYSRINTSIYVVGGMMGLIWGESLIMENTLFVTKYFHLDEKLIILTVISIGSSLPELITSLVAIARKRTVLAIGNIIGSNLFNLLVISGTTTLFYGPLKFTSALNTDLYVVFAGTILLLLFTFSFRKYRIGRAEGGVYLIGFITYIYYIFFREGII